MEIQIKIQGTTPLMCARFSDEAALAASSGSRGSSAASDRGSPQDIAEKSLYIGLSGKPAIPQPNILRCLVDGGQFFKVGKTQVTSKERSLLCGCLDIEEAEIVIEHAQPWRVDTRPVVIPATKGRILAHRAVFDDWELSFSVLLDTTILGEKLLREIVDAAGKRVGLGAYRPARKGPFGRFVVVRWEAGELALPERRRAA